MLKQETLEYILNFLAGFELPQGTIGYTANRDEFGQYKLVIVPCGFFDKKKYGRYGSLPSLPLEQVGGTPLLYGKPHALRTEETCVVYADIVASTYFLISRYEETVCTVRDQEGRMPTSASTLHQIDCIHRPLVDEYGELLRQWLKELGVDVPERSEGFAKVHLTHDVDKITQYRNLRGFAGGMLRGLRKKSSEHMKSVLKAAFCGAEYDPLYTFDWLFEQNKRVKDAETVVFFKAGRSWIRQDQPCYRLRSREVQGVFDLCRKHRASMGLHASYKSGKKPQIIASEKRRLERAMRQEVTYNRHHYLRSCEAQDMQALVDAGITDDFTMGFADWAGFRLGTCRAVRWINPTNGELTKLTLHPLTIMECTLSGAKYMNLPYEKALKHCKQLIEQVYKHGGEVNLLWHNTSVSRLPEYANYEAKLYEEVVGMIQEKQKM